MSQPGSHPMQRQAEQRMTPPEHGKAIRAAAKALNETIRAAAFEGVGVIIWLDTMAEAAPEVVQEVRVTPYARL